MEDFENLTEEDIQQLMELGILPDQLQSLQSQIDTAQALRDREAPRGQRVGPSGVYVAASPLEHLSYALQGIKAGKDIDRLRQDQQRILAEQVRGRSRYFGKLNDTPYNRANKQFMQGVQVDPTLVETPDINY